MSGGRRAPGLMDELDQLDPFTLLVVLAVLFVVAVAVAKGLWRTVLTWLVAHHALIPAPQSLVTIPSTGVGLDGRRLVVAVLGVIALAAVVKVLFRLCAALSVARRVAKER